MRQPRVILSVTNDLVTDQRVHRSCSALSEAGFRVTLVGRRLPGSAPLQRPYHTRRLSLLFRKKALFYAEYNLRLFLHLLFAPADLFYANDTDTLLANYLAARLRRKPLFFDAHEMFPEVPELVGRDRVRRVWTKIEDLIFPRLARRPDMAAVTVCQSIADIYRQRYGLSMAVVRNVPLPSPSTSAPVDDLLAAVPAGKRILLYQGAINIGRGIEWMMAAMPMRSKTLMMLLPITLPTRISRSLSALPANMAWIMPYIGPREKSPVMWFSSRPRTATP